MAPSKERSGHRSPAELRIAFKAMAARRLPRASTLEQFDLIWDEANRAASALAGTMEIGDYVSLLKEMHGWYADELKGPV